MTTIPIVLTRPVEEEYVRQIVAVDPRIEVLDGWPFMNAEDHGDFSRRGQFDALLARAEILCGFWPPVDAPARTPRLKWLHAMLAGLDHPGFARVMAGSVLLSNSAGIHRAQVSEFALMLMLNLVKGAPRFFQAQQERHWSPAIPGVLEGKTLGIVGLGNIGRATARLGRAFGMRVVATRRSASEAAVDADADLLLPAAALPELLARSDFVVVALPAIPATRGMIGEQELQAMKPSAYLINIARGTIVVEGALVRAVQEGWIAGAGLDTTASEPLPPESELWGLPNVIVTPHVSGRRPDYNRLAIPLFCENLLRYLRGERLINQIDKDKGY